jgi:hypothetical protein
MIGKVKFDWPYEIFLVVTMLTTINYTQDTYEEIN